MTNYGYIYKVTDLLNRHNLPNPFYVGQHKGKVDLDYYGSGVIIKPLVKKYGTDSFKLEIIAYAFSKYELDIQEVFWIKENNCRWPNGYNLAEGGDGGGRTPGYRDSEDTKRKRVETRKNNGLPWHTEEQKDTRRKNINLKRPKSEETISKMRKPKSEEHKKNMRSPKSQDHRKKIGSEILGRRHIYNPISKQEKFVKTYEVQGYLDLGWILGRIS